MNLTLFDRGHLSEILEQLVLLRADVEDGTHSSQRQGICYSVESCLDDYLVRQSWCILRQEVFAAWPEYSGNSMYPVPCPDSLSADYEGFFDEDTPAEAWAYENVEEFDGDSLWTDDHYGYNAGRIRLLQFTIDTLTEYLVGTEG